MLCLVSFVGHAFGWCFAGCLMRDFLKRENLMAFFKKCVQGDCLDAWPIVKIFPDVTRRHSLQDS